MSRAWPCVLALGCAGCIAMPYGVPPTRVDLATGVRDTSTQGIDVPGAVHVGFFPLAFDPGFLGRRVDLGLGYLFEGGDVREIHGAYLEGTLAFYRRYTKRGIIRIDGGAQLRLLYDPQSPDLGRGMALRVALEYAQFASGSYGGLDHDGGAFGVAFGEAGIGGFVEGGYGQFAVDNVFQLMLGVQIRLPATVGIAFAWLTGSKSK